MAHIDAHRLDLQQLLAQSSGISIGTGLFVDERELVLSSRELGSGATGKVVEGKFRGRLVSRVLGVPAARVVNGQDVFLFWATGVVVWMHVWQYLVRASVVCCFTSLFIGVPAARVVNGQDVFLLWATGVVVWMHVWQYLVRASAVCCFTSLCIDERELTLSNRELGSGATGKVVEGKFRGRPVSTDCYNRLELSACLCDDFKFCHPDARRLDVLLQQWWQYCSSNEGGRGEGSD
jgi:hypothetical protein